MSWLTGCSLARSRQLRKQKNNQKPPGVLMGSWLAIPPTSKELIAGWHM